MRFQMAEARTMAEISIAAEGANMNRKWNNVSWNRPIVNAFMSWHCPALHSVMLQAQCTSIVGSLFLAPVPVKDTPHTFM